MNSRYCKVLTKAIAKTYKPAEGDDVEVKKVLLWDRKAEGGFPGLSFYDK
jgi:predicted Rdx family selenoprotein